MLSRQNFNQNVHLHRAKSTSSIHPRPRSAVAPVLLDSPTLRQHALLAASVAYERSHGKENVLSTQAVDGKQQLRRKRSNRPGGFEGEGSHFQQPLEKGPRRQRSKRTSGSHSEDTKDYDSRQRNRTMTSSIALTSTTARDFVPVCATSDAEDENKFVQHRSSISVHKLRKAKSMYSTSSTTRHAMAESIDDISFAPPDRQPPLPPPLEEDTVTSIQELDMEQTVDITTTSTPVPLATTDLDHLPNHRVDFGMLPSDSSSRQSIRHRASLMLTPFKKRRNMTPTATAPLPRSDPAPAYASIVHQPEPMTLTTPRFDRKRASSEAKKDGSLRAKIRSVFRRSSNPLQELPMQQVNASRAYFGQPSSLTKQGQENTKLSSPSLPQDHTTERNSFIRPPSIVARGTSPSYSMMSIGVKSRVTSWADSTIAGTIIETEEEHHSDDVLLSLEDTRPTLRRNEKFSSMSLFKKMKRSSRIGMPSSEDVVEPGVREEVTQVSRTKSQASAFPSRHASSGRDSLPSQIRKTIACTNASIRAVSPHPGIGKLEVPVLHDLLSSATPSTSVPSPASALRKCLSSEKPSALAAQATPPNAEQIASRVRKSEDRWQEPLDGGRSLFYPRSPKRASSERHLRVDDDDDVFSTDGDGKRGSGLISPSVYSQDGICRNLDAIAELTALPPPPLERGTAVVLNSHHVARYSVGSPKKPEAHQARKTSKDWRSWLESETRELESPTREDLQLSTNFSPCSSISGHRKELAQVLDDGDSEGEIIEYEQHVETGMDQKTARPVVLRRAVPAVEWQPNQIPRVIQHASESSNPSTLTSSQSQQRRGSPTIDERYDAEGETTRYLNAFDTSSSSRGRNLVHRYASDDRPSSRLHDINETCSIKNRPSSRMNDRFPYVPSSRPTSRASGHVSTPAQSLHTRPSRSTMVQKVQSTANKNKENLAPSPSTSLPTPTVIVRPRLALRRPMSSVALISGRSPSSLAYYTNNLTMHNSSPTASLPPTPAPQPSLLPRPVQSYSTPRRPTSSLTHRACLISDLVEKKKKHISMPSLETDPTLASILQGPYRERSGLTKSSPTRPFSVRNSSSLNLSPQQENSAPTTPKMCTSKGLASNDIPRPGTSTSGQRLAEQFLNARRYREELKVMTPGEGSPAGESVDVSLSSFGGGAFL